MNPLTPPDQNPPASSSNELMPGDINLIPVIEEQVRIDKRMVETGRVLIQKHVGEREETVIVPLNHDEVTVDRVSINRYVDTPPAAIRYEGETMVISVLEEVVVTEKRLMLIEELHVTKRQVQTQETQQVVLRKETVTVTRQPGMEPDGGPAQSTN